MPVTITKTKMIKMWSNRECILTNRRSCLLITIHLYCADKCTNMQNLKMKFTLKVWKIKETTPDELQVTLLHRQIWIFKPFHNANLKTKGRSYKIIVQDDYDIMVSNEVLNINRCNVYMCLYLLKYNMHIYTMRI